MNKQQLLILCDPDMNADECTIAREAVTNVCTWLLEQPRQMGVDSCMPQFSELTFRIGKNRLNKGLRHKHNGTGWQTLRYTTHFGVMSTPRQIVEASHVDAISGAAVFMLNQLFRCESWNDEDFRREEHYRMQMRWLEQHSPDLYERTTRKIRADGVKQRNAARRDRKRKPPSQSTQSPKSTDSQSLIHPPMNPRQAPVQKPITPPTPELSAYQQQVIAEHKAMWDFIKSRSDSCDSACGSAEDFDKRSGVKGVCRDENPENLEDK